MDTLGVPADLAEGLSRLAADGVTPRWTSPVRRLAAEVTVSVSGRPGVGVGTVRRALTAMGLPLTDGPAGPAPGDVEVRVVAEIVKPEDRAAVTGADGPIVMVFTKADLCRADGSGALAAARRCANRGTRVPVPAEPLIGLLAVAGSDPAILDEGVVAALRTLTGVPADLSSVDAFVRGPHALPPSVRHRLADRLDLFGIASAVLALRTGAASDAAGLRGVFRAESGIDGVCAAIGLAIAEARYRRHLAVGAELEARAATDPCAAALLRDRSIAGARTFAARAVLRAAGMTPGASGAGDAGLFEALRWQNHGAGPVTALHRSCAADLTRHAMRGWERSQR